MARRHILLVAGPILLLLFLVLAIAVHLRSEAPPHPTKYSVLQAAEIGNVDALKGMLQADPALVNATDEYGETALHKAANKHVAKLLVAAGADVDANKCGWTPLHSAKNKGVAEVLVATGADVNAKSRQGRTPLHCAGSRELAEFLISNGADINAKADNGDTPLHSVIERKHRSVAELLIDKGAYIDIFGATALGLADLVNDLLEKDLNLVHAINANGSTPLHIAAAWGQVQTSKLLIAADAPLNIMDKQQRTPLHEAVRTGHQDVATLLIGKGAELDIFLTSALGLTDRVEDFLKVNPRLIHAKDTWGEEPLHKAAEWGRIETIQLLIAKGADITRKSDNEEWAPLFWALRSGQKQVAELLISEGANIESRDSYNWTPLQWAAERGREDVVEFLISKGANVNSEALHCWTPLHLAAEQGHAHIAKLLIKNGAKINKRDSFGRTPLDIAVSWGRKQTAELLRKHGAKE